jgi:hypothetical protein
LPRPLAKLLERVLEPDLDRRISSAADLEVELERLIGLLGPVTTRDVASCVQKHLGRRIAARREVVETALRAADGRIKLTQAFNAALEHDRLADDEASSMDRRRDATTALETPAPLPDALVKLVESEPAALAAPGSGGSPMPRSLRGRPWLPSAAVLAMVAAVAVLAVSWPKPAAVPPPEPLAALPNPPLVREKAEEQPRAAVVPAAVAEAEPVATAAPALSSASKARPHSAGRPAAQPSIARRTGTTPPAAAAGKQDVLKAFSERR